MAWARIDDAFFNHPKVRKAGKNAVIFHLAALCHSNAFTTDGFIADDMLELIAIQAFQRKANGLADRLVECGLWDRIEGGYLIHDYLEYNYSKQQIEESRTKKAAAGSKGAQARWQNDGKTIAPAIANGWQNDSKQDSKQDSKTMAISHTHINTHKELKDSTTTTRASDELVDSIYQAYKREIGEMTPAVMDDILAAIDDYPPEWFVEAFEEAARNNKQSWKYALAILKRWKVDGYKVDTRTARKVNKGYNTTKPTSAGLDEILAGAPIFAEDKK